MNPLKTACVFLLLCINAALYAQNTADQITLAQQYMSSGDYDKAADIYAYLYKNNPESNANYKNYFSCLLAKEDFKEAEKIVRKQQKINPENLTYYVDLGNIYDKQGNDKLKNETYATAISKIGNQRIQVVQLANAFMANNDIQNAIATYEKGKKTIPDYTFNYELANLYYRLGSIEKTLNLYLDYLSEDDNNLQNVENILQQIVNTEKLHEQLQTILYDRIQKSNNDVIYTELLVWDFIQLKDFDGAFIQEKALDKRLKEDGKRVFDLGEAAENENAFDAAIKCYQYIIDKGVNSPFYFIAKNGVLDCLKQKIEKTNTYTQTDLIGLKNNYENFLNEYQKQDGRGAMVTDDLAKLNAFYLHDIDRAIALLEQTIIWPALKPEQLSKLKLDLGDFYLIKGNVWDATLVYSQVDKAMKDAPLGEMARYKNAKLAYYRGDFDYAQGMLNVLKAATSELVANDAMKLSVFITENLALDSVSEPMQLFATADLLVFQNKPNDALAVLDSIEKKYPDHGLADDILFLKSTIYIQQQNITEAIKDLEQIKQQYSTALLADDAIFKLAELYQYNLKDLEKAKAGYEEIILHHKDSLYVTEARKRFRQLRGDIIN